MELLHKKEELRGIVNNALLPLINNDYILFERNKNDEKIVVGVNRTGDVKIINKQEENELQLFSLNESNSKKLNPHGAFVIKKTKNTTHK